MYRDEATDFSLGLGGTVWTSRRSLLTSLLSAERVKLVGRNEMATIGQILFSILEDVVDDRGHTPLCLFNAFENQEMAVLHGANDRPVLEDEIATSREASRLQ